MRCFIRCVFLLLLCSSLPHWAEAVPKHATPVAPMQAFVVEHGLNNFVQHALNSGWNAPSIFSAWHVDNVAAQDKKSQKTSTRNFGRLLAIKVAVEAERMRSPESAEQALQQSSLLLDLADWLNQTRGYGNLVLGVRCLDLASVGLANCLVDPDISQEQLAPLLVRLRPLWMESEARRKILNAEAGKQIFFSGPDAAKTAPGQRLARIWAIGQTQHMEAKNPKLKARRLQYEQQRKAKRQAQQNSLDEESYFDRPEIVGNLPFFKDDDIRGPETTVDAWDRKQHGKFATGIKLASVEKLEALAEFKKKVGSFPTNFDVEHAFFTGGKAAFDLAWRPHATQENRLLYVTAWRAYDELKRGCFMDQESMLSRFVRNKGAHK